MFQEIIRVLKPGKKIIIMEANAKNLFWHYFGMMNSSEAGLKYNTFDNFSSLLQRNTSKFSYAFIDYLDYPVFLRFFLHYKFGLKNIGNSRAFIGLLGFVSKYLKIISIKKFWPYIFILAVKKSK
jgi:ubiquinone/menaquinone biosynthesis C-methylase UbiE